MHGLRAYGRNEGGLGHTGDFAALFAPVLPSLAGAAVYGPQFRWCVWEEQGLTSDEPDAAWDAAFAADDERADRLCRLTLHPLKSENDFPDYFAPGLFPEFAPFVLDDWNTVVAFDRPFPPLAEVERRLAAAEVRGTHDSTAELVRARMAFAAAGFAHHFSNVDACYWEYFSPDTAAFAAVRDHLTATNYLFDILDSRRDWPFATDPPTAAKTDFAGVKTIWRPGGG